MVDFLRSLKFHKDDEKAYEYQRFTTNRLLVISIISSIFYAFVDTNILKITLLFLAIVSIRVRKLIATGTGEDYERTWVINIVFSRISEILIFSTELHSHYSQVLFFFLIVNLVLTLLTVKFKTHISLPLRFVLIIIYILKIVG